MKTVTQILQDSYRLPPYQRIFGLEARLDGLSFTFHVLSFSRVRDFIENLLPVTFKFEQQEFGSRWYENFYLGACGSSLHSYHRQGYLLGLCQLGGEFFSHLDSFAQKRLIDFVFQIGAKPSVIALDLDDYNRRFSPQWFLNEWQSARCGGFKVWEKIKSFEPRKKSYGYGDTIAFGRRGNLGGQKRFVCYDKYVESEILNCYRYELTLYKNKAQSALKMLADTSIEKWHFLIANIITGEIKFSQFKIGSQPLSMGYKKPKNCLYKKAGWMNRQCSLVFAALCQVHREMGSDFASTLEESGKGSPKYPLLVDSFRNFYSLNGVIEIPFSD